MAAGRRPTRRPPSLRLPPRCREEAAAPAASHGCGYLRVVGGAGAGTEGPYHVPRALTLPPPPPRPHRPPRAPQLCILRYKLPSEPALFVDVVDDEDVR